MNILSAIILAIIEGLTEFLPISSTGHLILAADLLKIKQTDFVKSYELAIQLGAIFSVLFLYKNKIFHKSLFLKTTIAFLPTSIVGLIFYKQIKYYLLGNAPVVIYALFCGGIILLLFEYWISKRKIQNNLEKLSKKSCLFIGLIQSIAIIPGVSRSAAAICGGLIAGLSRKEAVEFSFILALPSITAAVVYDLGKSGIIFSSSEIYILLLGMIVSFFTAIIAIKFFIKIVQDFSFVPFAFYRILLALLFAYIYF